MKKFIKTVEDFICEKCGAEVEGDGYTNHCPKCLFGKHVDINPGDRAESCLGLMKPISLESRSGKFVITHQCQKCGFERKNRADAKDDLSSLLR